MSDEAKPAPLEPEVLPPEGGPTLPPPLGPRLWRAFGPVVAGMLLDLVDFATLGPAGLVLGLPLGALTGWILTGMLGWPPKHRYVGALLAGIYCTIPGTSFIPLGTLCGALSRFFEFPRPQQTGGDGGPRR